MEKNSKIILSVVIIVAIIVVASASAYFLVDTQTRGTGLLPPGKIPADQVSVTGDVSAPATLSVSDLTKLTLVNVTVTLKGSTGTYLGVTLPDLLDRAGASWDTGFITVVGSDGYSKTINFYQAYNSTKYPGEEIILAFAKNGEWLSGTSDGPFKLIAPGFATAYDVYDVTEIKLTPWTISVTGIANSMTLVGSNITKYGTQTVEAAFAPGGQPQVTASWTGTSLWSILQAGGVPTGASNVTVVGIDGYSQQFTISQIQSAGMLIGYKENGQYLTPNMGQPFRLICPTEDFKWGRYWVGWVAQVIVS